MPRDEIKEKVKKVFEEVFPQEEFRWDKKQEEFPQWDSLSHMELVGKIEEVFGIRLETEEIMGLASPADFLKAVSPKNV